MRTIYWLDSLKGGDHSEDLFLDLDGKIIFKCILLGK
jgi:hypothetical protein